MQNRILLTITLFAGLEVSGGSLLGDHLPSCSAPPVPVAACEICQPQPGCSAPVSVCNGCQPQGCPGVMPECSICNGQAMCWDCSWEEGIDVDSLTDEAQSKRLYLASQASIRIDLPEKSSVYLLDQRMSTPGPRRTFVIPIPDQTKDYRYEVRVDLVANGKKYFKRHKIESIRAGMILWLKVEATAAEGEAPKITVEEVALEEGGKPPEDSEETDKTVLNSLRWSAVE
jgi:hypothetical protein